MNKLTLEIYYVHHQQLSLFYVGLELLNRLQIINVRYNFSNANSTIPILYGSIDGKTFCIDCMDGLNWIAGDLEQNLSYFSTQIRADFLFKRNFFPELQSYKTNSKVLPFGFNYAMGLGYRFSLNQLPQFFANPYWTLRFYRLLGGYYDFRTFEAEPILPREMGVLFQVRLWDPNDAKDSINAIQRETINQMRIDAVRQLKKHFPKHAFVGVSDSNFARANCPDLILGQDFTSRRAYFERIRKTAIGIASTGLHQSIGWKIGEYIAASRAILSEQSVFQLPLEFKEGRNYESFTTPSDLISTVDSLLSFPNRIQDMMNENKRYYQQDLRPDQLVLKLLKKILE